MLLEICDQLRSALKSRGVPYPVVYGPERFAQTALASPHIVVERDRSTGDRLAPPTTHRRNPMIDHVRHVGAVLRVYATSTTMGATTGNHERVADHVVDQVLCAMRRIVSERRTLWELGTARLLTAEELQERGLEAWAGVVYEIRCSIARGVTDTPWDGSALGEVVFGGAGVSGTSTTVDLSDGPDGSGGILPSATTR